MAIYESNSVSLHPGYLSIAGRDIEPTLKTYCFIVCAFEMTEHPLDLPGRSSRQVPELGSAPAQIKPWLKRKVL